MRVLDGKDPSDQRQYGQLVRLAVAMDLGPSHSQFVRRKIKKPERANFSKWLGRTLQRSETGRRQCASPERV